MGIEPTTSLFTGKLCAPAPRLASSILVYSIIILIIYEAVVGHGHKVVTVKRRLWV